MCVSVYIYTELREAVRWGFFCADGTRCTPATEEWNFASFDPRAQTTRARALRARAARFAEIIFIVFVARRSRARVLY